MNKSTDNLANIASEVINAANLMVAQMGCVEDARRCKNKTTINVEVLSYHNLRARTQLLRKLHEADTVITNKIARFESLTPQIPELV